jgi:ATP-binding cassette subfamily B protein
MKARAGNQPSTLTHVEREEREDEIRPLSLRLIRRLAAYTRPYAARRNSLLAIVIIRSIQLPSLAWLIGAVVGGPVARLDVEGIVLGAVAYGLLAALTQITLHYRSLLALKLGEDVIADLRNHMFTHVQSQEMRFFHRTRLGRIISRFTSDAEAIRVGVQDVLFVSLVQGGQMIVAAGFMTYYDPVLMLLVSGMTPILWGINRIFQHRLSRAYRAVQESFSRITATLAESVSGVRVTQGFVREDFNAGLFHDLVKDHYRYNLDAARSAGVFIPLLEFNTQLFIALILLVGGWRAFHGLTAVEDLYQFVLMANLFFGPVQGIGGQYNNALSAMAGAERVLNFLDRKPEWSDPPDAVNLPDIGGQIEFEHVDFGYDPNRLVLRDICFTANPGQTVALVGHTGSGKTSIINLIAKFYLPTAGSLRIDGLDIRKISSTSLHQRLGVVLQQNFLFTGTVMDNILMGKPGARREHVIEAAIKLDCLDLIESLPEGFSTVVGEGGIGISLGQRQLICFTRAMLADPRILILDEATSSVDTLTEARIQKALVTLLRNRTSIVVAHRLSTIRHANQVLVLQDGLIVERGTHNELLVADGVYADLYEQFISAADE